MKLLMTADAVGGVWTYALELAAALGERAEVVLAVLGPAPSATHRVAAARVSNVELVPIAARLEWMPDAAPDVAASAERLLELADARSVDLVHLNGYAQAAFDWRRPVVVVAHSCVTTWWRAVHGTDPPPDWREYRAGVARGLSAADAVVAPTHAFLTRLEAAHGPILRARVIRNGRAASAATAPATRAPAIFACGRLWDEAKAMRTLDRAARGLAWPVRIAGDLVGPGGTPFVPEAATCLGRVSPDDVAAELACASIFVHPALYEPFGLAPLEAALAGCALVLADLPELRELWGGAAEFVPARDPYALHAALARLIADEARRTSLGAAARERAVAYGTDAMAARYLALYAELLAERRTSRAVA
jgi:glycogen synthase